MEYWKHVMNFGALLFQLLSEAFGLNSEILKKIDCLRSFRFELSEALGLRVLHKDHWVDVTPIHGALVGTGNRDGPRISVACFFSSNLFPNSTVYEPIKELLSDENPAKYRDTTIPEYTAGYLAGGFNGKSHLSKFRI
ncbi:unnamed protein product [Brassica napus]|uniref:(rape) hypothetical protein n=1 Tax=Brassica napus TaxID=3708 RepID=A0A816NX35_BRANA|nr:unnamed protein product [Brassica napus]